VAAFKPARARWKAKRIVKVSRSPTFCLRKILHPKIAEPVWCAFMRGEVDVAAFQAMKAVEVSGRAVVAVAFRYLASLVF
jgi:hypothetical protein